MARFETVLAPPYRFSIQDNDSWMYTLAPHCSTCTWVLDESWVDPAFRLAKRHLDLSVTWDGCTIASSAFVAACTHIDGTRFDELPTEPGFFLMRVDQVVRVDAVANGTRFGEPCDECRQPTFVVRPGPLFLPDGETMPAGVTRTDLGYGDTADFGPAQPNHLVPVLMADSGTAAHLNSAGLTGVHLFPPGPPADP